MEELMEEFHSGTEKKWTFTSLPGLIKFKQPKIEQPGNVKQAFARSEETSDSALLKP